MTINYQDDLSRLSKLELKIADAEFLYAYQSEKINYHQVKAEELILKRERTARRLKDLRRG